MNGSNVITPEQKVYLMGLPNTELQRIIDNPMMYSSPQFVNEAAKILTKRNAWEMIKDYSNDQLMDILHNNKMGFAEPVLDAASMELFMRQAPTFVEEVMQCTDEQLASIVGAPNNNYEGYVKMAEKVIEQHKFDVFKDYTDEELMALLQNNEQNLSFEMLDIASLVLFNRQSQLLLDDFKNETPESLKEIVDNSHEYYQGYVKLATNMLAMYQNGQAPGN